jgi:hypothetical protein
MISHFCFSSFQFLMPKCLDPFELQKFQTHNMKAMAKDKKIQYRSYPALALLTNVSLMVIVTRTLAYYAKK